MKVSVEKIDPSNSHSFHNSKIIEIGEVASNIFKIRIENAIISRNALPGQFINIKITENYVPFWRRPFSIHQIHAEEGWAEILFRVVGKGTQLLSKMKRGEILNFIGPLGNSFDYSENLIQSALLVAGGLGIAPLLFLSQFLVQKGIKPYLFYGTKSEAEFCCLEQFKAIGTDISLATEDGSMGFKGFVTDMVNDKILEIQDRNHVSIFACGPNPMLSRLLKLPIILRSRARFL
jgi:dihydroorotate dehydrogenase electron transfer subunit